MIHLLPRDVRETVRSGIAIATATQCMEELVLNALDADASCVAIRLDLDILRVQVVDNGAGISLPDLEKVGERYMTSKCSRLDDLKRLVHHGYRGEALASIVDVSGSVEIQTRKDGVTYRKMMNGNTGSRIETCESRRASVGTTVTVAGLFDRFPVRRKSMKASLEKERIISLLQSFSLAYHQVTFSLRDDVTGTVLYQSKRHGTLANAFKTLYGGLIDGELDEVTIEKDDITVHCHISQSAHWDKNLQFVYVNHRRILKSGIHDSMNELLRRSSRFRKLNRETAPTSRVRLSFPVFVVLIKLPYLDYDITFDPAKTFVEFHDWATVNACLKKAVDRFLALNGLEETIDDLKENELADKNCDSPLPEPQVIRLDELHESLFSKPACRPKSRLDISVQPCSGQDLDTVSVEGETDIVERKSISSSDTGNSPSVKESPLAEKQVEMTERRCDNSHTASPSSLKKGDNSRDQRLCHRAMDDVTNCQQKVHKNQQNSGESSIPASLNVADLFPSETSVPESLRKSDVISSESVIPNEASCPEPKIESNQGRKNGASTVQVAGNARKVPKSRERSKRRNSSSTDVVSVDSGRHGRRKSDRLKIGKVARTNELSSESSKTNRASTSSIVEPAKNLRCEPNNSHCEEKGRRHDRIVEWICASTAEEPRRIGHGRAEERSRRRSGDTRPPTKRHMSRGSPGHAGSTRTRRKPTLATVSPSLPKFQRKRKRSGNRDTNRNAVNAGECQAASSELPVTCASGSKKSVRRKLSELQSKVKKIYRNLTKTPTRAGGGDCVSTPPDQVVEIMTVSPPGPGRKSSYHLRLERRRLKVLEKNKLGETKADEDCRVRCRDETLSEDCAGIESSKVKSRPACHESESLSLVPPRNGEHFKIPTVVPLRSAKKCTSELSSDLLNEREGHAGRETTVRLLRKTTSCQKRDSKIETSYAVPKVASRFVLQTPLAVKRRKVRSEQTVAPQQSPYFRANHPLRSPYFSDRLVRDTPVARVPERGAVIVKTPVFLIRESGRKTDGRFHVPETPFCVSENQALGNTALQVLAPPSTGHGEPSVMPTTRNGNPRSEAESPARDDVNGIWKVSSYENLNDSFELNIQAVIPETPDVNPFGGEGDQVEEFEIQYKTPKVNIGARNRLFQNESQIQSRPSVLKFPVIETQPFSPSFPCQEDEFRVWTPSTAEILRSQHFTITGESAQPCEKSMIVASDKAEFESSQSVSDASEKSGRPSPKYKSARKQWLTRWKETTGDVTKQLELTREETEVIPGTLDVTSSLTDTVNISVESVSQAEVIGPVMCDTSLVLPRTAVMAQIRALNEPPSVVNVPIYSEAYVDTTSMQSDSVPNSGVPGAENDETAAGHSSCHDDKTLTESDPSAADTPAPSRVEASSNEIIVGGQNWLVVTDSLGRYVYIDPKTGNSRLEKPVSPERGSLDAAASKGGLHSFTSHPVLSYGASLFQPRSKDDRTLKLCDEAEVERIMTSRLKSLDKDRDIKWRCVTYEGIANIQKTWANWQNPVFERSKNILNICREADSNNDIRYHHHASKTHTFVKEDFHNMEVLNQVDEKFIACVLNSVSVANGRRLRYLVLIDQHAAHERVRLEMFTEALTMDNGDVRSAQIAPMKFTFPQPDLELLVSYQRKLSKLGLEFRTCTDQLMLNAVPYCFSHSDRKIEPDKDKVHSLITELIQTCRECRGAFGTLPQTVQELLWSQACHGAIKFGDKLNPKECRDLIKSLGTCQLPFQCAHGRPSLVPLLDVLELDETLGGVNSAPDLCKLIQVMRQATG